MHEDLIVRDEDPLNLTSTDAHELFSAVVPQLSSPLKRLPPLNSLRAFVTTAKHLSFTKAARELNVTSGAVSQQVKLLEDHLDCLLFRRTKQALLLTEGGRACLPGLIQAFHLMSVSLADIQHAKTSSALDVLVSPSFAAKWLIARLDGFRKCHKDIDVRIAVAGVGATMDTSDFDCAIRYGNGRFPGFTAEKLMSECVVPVCAPTIAETLHTETDLVSQTLIHDESPDEDLSCPDWATWLRVAGVTGVNAARGVRFNQSCLAIEAAIAGQGVALAKARLAARDINLGRLCRVFDRSYPVTFSYFFLSPKRKHASRKLQLFKAWLQREAARSP